MCLRNLSGWAKHKHPFPITASQCCTSTHSIYQIFQLFSPTWNHGLLKNLPIRHRCCKSWLQQFNKGFFMCCWCCCLHSVWGINIHRERQTRSNNSVSIQGSHTLVFCRTAPFTTAFIGNGTALHHTVYISVRKPQVPYMYAINLWATAAQ